MARGFKIADAYIEAHLDDTLARQGVRDLPKRIGNDAENSGKTVGRRVGKGLGDGVNEKSNRSGRDAGDKLSKGMELAIVRNSPLIAAAVGGSLLVGAPVMLAGATALFGGIGIVAAAQNEKVKASYSDLWKGVKSGAEDAATSIVPTLETAASQLRVTFLRLTPDLRATFDAAAPQITTFVRGVDDAALRAMPGFRRAVQSSMPVTVGLANLLRSTGSGLADFFTTISHHSPAAGQALTGLGNTVGNLLPILGELTGQGAELGAVVLPALSSVLGGLNTVLRVTGPLLPAIVGGFSGFRLASTAAGWLGNLETKLSTTAAKGGMFSGAMGKAASAVGTVGSALPAVGTSLGVLAVLWQNSNRQIEDWSSALVKGGSAAAQATAEMDRQKSAGFGLSEVWDRMKFLTNDGIAQLQGYSGVQDKVTQGMKAQLAQMDPLQRAQTLAAQAQADLNDAIDRFGPGSSQAEAAAHRYATASADVKRVQGEEEQAIHGVTQAMIDQADQAMAGIDSTFAAQHAAIQQRDAEKALRDAIREHGAASQEAHDRQLDYNESIYRFARATATAAADQSGLKAGTVEYKQYLDSQLLGALERVVGSLTGPTRAAVEGFIQKLKDAGVTSDTTGGKLDALGAKRPTPEVNLKDNTPKPTRYILDELLNVNRQRPTPVVDMNISQAKGHFDTVMYLAGVLGQQRPTVTVTALTGSAQQQINEFISANQNRVIYTPLVIQKQLHTGGPVTHAASGRVVGPGDGSVDTVPAIGPDGSPWALANHEWVIRAAVARAQGDARMALLNAGRATIVPTGSGSSAPSPVPSLNPSTGTGAMGGGLRIGHLTIAVSGTFDLSRPGVGRKIAEEVRDELRKIDKEYR